MDSFMLGKIPSISRECEVMSYLKEEKFIEGLKHEQESARHA
jgi:hypothetical protein